MDEIKKEEQFPSNSIIKKQEKKEIQKVTTGKVYVKKPGIGKKLANTFLGEDAENVKTYLLMDVVVPAIKDTIVDMVCSGVEMIFGVRGRGGSRRFVSRRDDRYTNYSNISYKQSDARDRPSRRERERDPVNNLGEGIVVATRSEAEDIIFRLADLCEMYGMATVADLYSLAGITGDFQSHRWGWETVASARAIRQRGGGFLIDMPRPIYLD